MTPLQIHGPFHYALKCRTITRDKPTDCNCVPCWHHKPSWMIIAVAPIISIISILRTLPKNVRRWIVVGPVSPIDVSIPGEIPKWTITQANIGHTKIRQYKDWFSKARHGPWESVVSPRKARHGNKWQYQPGSMMVVGVGLYRCVPSFIVSPKCV